MLTFTPMKNLLLLLSVLLFSSTLQAKLEQVSRVELYRQIFDKDSTSQCKGHLPCKMLRRHLIRDNTKCQMNPLDVEVVDQHINSSVNDPTKTKSSMRFLGIYPGAYAYHSFNNQAGEVVIKARIHIKNSAQFTSDEIKNFRSKLHIAAKLWDQNNPYQFKAVFDFDLADLKREAAVSVRLLRGKTRGPYFSKWSTAWSVNTLAHEFGHVMGLDDEYANSPFGGSTAKCDKASLMCSSSQGKPRPYHYYLIFRRPICR